MSNDNQPATLHDLDTWGGELTHRIDNVENRLDRVENVTERILDVVQGIDKKLTPLLDLPERVDRLEEDVLKLQTKR